MNIICRKANRNDNDIELLIKLRLAYLNDDRGELSEQDKSAVISQLKEYYPKHLESDFIAYIAETDSNIIAAAFLVIKEVPANPAFITGKTGTILNVFTYPEYRKKGIATKLLELVIEEAKIQNLSFIELSATESGKPLYEKLGFQTRQPSKYTEMRLNL